MTQALKTVIATAKNHGQRLDIFLFEMFPDYSRSYFQEIIDQDCVRVGERLVSKASFRLAEGQLVEVLFPEKKNYSVAPLPVSFEILDEQEDFVVINKPAGLLVHAASTHDPEPTLVNGLMHYFHHTKLYQEALLNAQSAESFRPGIIHRLDKDTSGILLVARTHRGQLRLAELFKERTIKKEYLAVVQGVPPECETITHSIGRHPIHRVKMAPFGLNARKAVSKVVTQEYFSDARTALIGIVIETGRTHQIRVHCAAQGYPIVGDQLYGSPSPFISRQALHAHKLSFNYDGKDYSYTCLVPQDIESLIIHYKKSG